MHGLPLTLDRFRRTAAAPDLRTAGTLYWYALSRDLAHLAMMAADAEHAHIHLESGWPRASAAPSTEEPLPALNRAYRQHIPALAAASGATAQALWAIATDSIATVALDTADPPAAAHAAVAACAPLAPAARFQQVPGRGTVVRRGSCCLIYRCAGAAKCLSCPRQTPEQRLHRLSAGADR